MTKILIIDDQIFVFHMIEKILKENGLINISYAPNGIKALELLESNEYNIITCDITMPEMDGIETAKKIFEKYPNQKIMMVTAMGQTEMIKKAISVGVKHYLLKPFTPEKFMEKFMVALV